MEQGKTRKDRILAVLRRVKAQEPEIQAAAKARVRELVQKAREAEDEKDAATSEAVPSAVR